MVTDSTGQLSELPIYDVQLTDAYLYQASVARLESPVEGTTPSGPTLEATVDQPAIDADGTTFHHSVGVKIRFPYNDGKHTLVIDCSVVGKFTAAGPLATVYVQQFAAKESVVLLWPYLRAAASELSRMTGLPVGPLPTLDVMGLIGRRPDRSGPATHRQKRVRKP